MTATHVTDFTNPFLTMFPWKQGLSSSSERMLSLEDCLWAAGGIWFVGTVIMWEVLSFSSCLSSSLLPSPSLLRPQTAGEKTSSATPSSFFTMPLSQAPPSSCCSFWRESEGNTVKKLTWDLVSILTCVSDDWPLPGAMLQMAELEWAQSMNCPRQMEWMKLWYQSGRTVLS